MRTKKHNIAMPRTRISALILLFFGMLVVVSSVKALDLVVLEPRVPSTGRWVRHDIWDQPEAVWTCKIVVSEDTIFDVCAYEEIFPQPEPLPWKRRLLDKDAIWVCIPNPVELSPIQAPFVKGNCLFASSLGAFPGSFVPTDEQLAQSEADYQRLMRARLAFDPAVAAQNPEQAYYLREQKTASKRAIFALTTLTNILEIAAEDDEIVKIVHNVLGNPIRAEIERFAARASDPADPNFREIVSAIPAVLPPIEANSNLSIELLQAVNQLRASLSEMLGLSKATLITLDRAAGARQAGEVEWEKRQLAAARVFDARYSQLARQLADQLTALGTALQRAGVTTIIEVTDVVTWQNSLPGQPFSAIERESLLELGLTQAQIEAAAVRMVAQSPEEVKSFGQGRVTAALSDQQIRVTFEEVAVAMAAGPIGAPWQLYLPTITR
jgi:hypothetical protein